MGALDLQYDSPIKVTDETLVFPFLCIPSSRLQGVVGLGDNEAAPDRDEDETNGGTAELVKITMIQDDCNVACEITRGVCEHPGKTDVQLRPV